MNYLGHPLEESEGGGGGVIAPVEAVAGLVQVVDTTAYILYASAGFFRSVQPIPVALAGFNRNVTDNITVDSGNLASIMVDLPGWYIVNGSMTLSVHHVGDNAIFPPVIDITCGFSTHEPGQVVSTWTANAPGRRQAVTVDGPPITFTFSGLGQFGVNTIFEHVIENHSGQGFTFTTYKHDLSVVRI